MKLKLKRSEVLRLLLMAGGTIFGVVFIKRSTGELREMNCRMNVKKYLKGGPPAYNPSEHNLLWVFDVQKMGYRSIALEGVQNIRLRGQEYEIAD